jgi:glycosyltransferase involved in cell wall biosynthesis
MTIGAMRNDARYELVDNGRWGPLLLRAPSMLIANSHAAVEGAVEVGVPASKLRFLANVIDVAEFDARMTTPVRDNGEGRPVVIAVGRLVAAKRFDRFLTALALARKAAPTLRGWLVGDGPERERLEQKAAALGLADNLEFKGARDDVPALMRQADVLALSSDHEGFPNVVLEAMTAGLPVVATPAGDAGRIVQEDVTGYVVPFEDVSAMAERLVRLTRCAALRQRLGAAARRCVERQYSYDVLADNLFCLYGDLAEQQKRPDIQRLLRI